MRLYVSNLTYGIMDQDLVEAFSQYGTVENATVIMDRTTGQSRGFGFVEMPNREEAEKAIHGLNGADWQGRKMNVSEARDRPDSNSRGLRTPRRTHGR